MTVHYSDVGKPHAFYGARRSPLLRFAALRLSGDWLALAFKIFRFRPDLVHINPGLDVKTFRSLRRDAMNILIARLLRRPVLVFWRGWDNSWCGQPQFPGGNKGLLCRIYKMATAHIVLSERFKQDLLRWGFQTPIHVDTTVVDADCLAASDPTTTDAGRLHLLYLSRVQVAKGVFELLDAYRFLKLRHPACTLTIAGDGPDLEALRGRAHQLKLTDVTFTGWVESETKVNCYRRADVFCFLSYTEGMPNAVLEAMALGLPVVSSNAGGLADILRDGETGFIVPFRKDAPPREKFDPVAVADAIERLAGDAALRRRIGDFNRQYARERVAAPVVAKRLEAIYRSVFVNEPVASENSESLKSACVE